MEMSIAPPRASNNLITMRLLFFVSAIVYANSDSTSEAVVFYKCCPKDQSLIKVSEFGDSGVSYQCIDSEVAYIDYNVTISSLIIGNVPVTYGIPECDEVQIVTSPGNWLRVEDSCYDRLELEIVNGTLKSNIPAFVGLSCIKNETEELSKEKILINHFRKCCPRGQSYDSNFHLCRNTEMNNTEDWLLKRLEMKDNDIYEVDNGLNCAMQDYGIELTGEFFTLVVDGSTLKALSRKGKGGGDVAQGEWCIDREYAGSDLVARVCAHDCSKYGAFCVRKCCPMGHHFRPQRCGSFASKCLPNHDEILFNITDYLEPLKRDGDITDVLGIRTGFQCPGGRTGLNKSIENDWHHLETDGRLSSSISVGYSYCFEAFDARHCPGGEIIITAVNCLEWQAEKNYRLSSILVSISSACLALTLVVYMSLPELRNLHGRTLMCYVSMMLLAFGCLARSQHGYVPNDTTCIALGYGTYFGLIAAFAWLNVMCFDIWWTLGSVRMVQRMQKADEELRRFLWYSLYAWSTAILLTLIMFLFDKYPVASFLDANIGQGKCWFGILQKSYWPPYIYFLVPMGLVSCTNFVLWVLTVRHCTRVKSEVHRLQADTVDKSAKRRFRVNKAKYVLTGKLWLVMGASWIAEFLTDLVSLPWWFLTIMNITTELRGVSIFLILVIKPKVYYLMRKRLGLKEPDTPETR